MIKIFWTKHAKEKIRYYRLSEKRVLRILRKPDRKEEGIVEGTIANMQVVGSRKNPTEAWTMYAILKKPKGIKIISAWRYPGRTPENQRPKIPEDILKDILFAEAVASSHNQAKLRAGGEHSSATALAKASAKEEI